MRVLVGWATAAAIAVGIAATISAGPAGAVSAAADTPDIVGARSCVDEVRLAGPWGNSHDEVLAGKVTILGHTATVDLAHLDFVHPPAEFADTSRAMWWRSMTWATPALYPSPAGPDAAADALLSDLVAGLDANPDPGSATPTALAQAVAAGWDEGTNLRREDVLNCLVWVSAWDTRIVDHLLAAVDANMDTVRYYGPPNHAPHNHGTMANLALLDTSILMELPDLATFAVARLRAEMGGLFAAGGFTYEQSTAYHQMNLAFWSSLVVTLTNRSDGGDLTALRALLGKAAAMSYYLTAPDGAPVPIGDGWPSAPDPPAAPTAQASTGITDVYGGIAAWRWSWRDPTTTFYTLRFGLRSRGHGHLDHTSFTWYTLGSSVLVDPGCFSYGSPAVFTAWQRLPQAHNLAVPAGATVTNAGSRLVSLRRVGAVDVSVVRSGQFSRAVTRTLRIDNNHHSVVVTDTTTGALTQHFHLAPGWTYLSRTARSMSFGNGHQRLLVSVAAAGVSLTVRRGATSPVAGWVFPGFETATRAVEILVTGRTTVTTTMIAHR